jgi:radical SAM superfamily enzyme YgiQ (UPF0313 family)
MKGFPYPPQGRSKVLLIFPKLFPKRTYQEDELVHFPLSVLQLAAALQEDNVDVTILDGRVEENYQEKILALKDELLCVGLSCLTGQVSQGLDIARFVRDQVPDIPIIWGGWHLTIFHETSIQSPHADIVARGEGDEIIREVVNALRNGTDLQEIHGITYKVNGEVRVNPDRHIAKDFKLVTLPYELLDNSRYEVKEGRINIITSRGCPQNCTYCTIQSYYTRHWYGREAEEIVDQIEHLVKRFDVKHFIFMDSNFFVNPKRTRAIAEGIINRGIDITWEASGHTKVLVRTDPDIYDLVMKSGCRQISVGVESGSPRMLNIIHKGLKLEEVFNLAEIIARSKIIFRTNFMVGLPGETNTDIHHTFNVIRKLHYSCENLKVTVYMYHPIPGSPMYEEEMQSGQIIDYPTTLEEWAEFKIESDIGWDATRPWRGKDLIENYRNRDNVRLRSFYLWAGCLSDGIERRLATPVHRMGYKVLRVLANMRLNTGIFALPFEWWIYQYYRQRK